MSKKVKIALIVILIIAVIAFLVYWFKFRKKDETKISGGKTGAASGPVKSGAGLTVVYPTGETTVSETKAD